MDIYVASSWRNNLQPQVVQALREQGYIAYDFKNPEPGDTGFHWSEIDPSWQNWTTEKFREALSHPLAESGFTSDMNALKACKICVLVLESGRSAHLEAGYAIGAGKPTIVLLQDAEPELMYKMTPFVCLNVEEVIQCVKYCLPNSKMKLTLCNTLDCNNNAEGNCSINSPCGRRTK